MLICYLKTLGRKEQIFAFCSLSYFRRKKKKFFLNPHNCPNWKRFLICFMAACLWLVSVQSKNLAPSPAKAVFQTFQLCSRAAGAAHSPEIPVQGPRWHAGAWPRLPFGPTQPAVTSASLSPSGSLSSPLSQHEAGPSSACGPGDWEVGWSHSDAGINQSH